MITGRSTSREERGWSWWLGRGAWSVGDQSLFAVSNFLVNVLVARRLSATEYGAFVFAYSAFQILGQIYIGMVVDPMQVFGSARDVATFPRYLRTLLRGHWLLTLPASAVLAVTGVVVHRVASTAVGDAFGGLAVAAPFILLTWLLRGACTVRVEPRLSAGGGAISLGIVITGIAILGALGALTVFRAFLLMGAANFVADIWLVVRLGFLDASVVRLDPGMRQQHWAYGRWSTGAGLLNWVPTEMFYMLLPIWGGLHETAALRAMVNLLLPATQLQFAMGNLLTPVLVRARGQQRFVHLIIAAAVGMTVAFGAYWLVLGTFRIPIMRLLYAGRFLESSALLWALGAVPLLSGLAVVLASALRAVERPDRIFWAALASSSTAAASIVLLPRWGLAGVAAARVLSGFAQTCALGLVLWFLLRREVTIRAPQATTDDDRLPGMGPAAPSHENSWRGRDRTPAPARAVP